MSAKTKICTKCFQEKTTEDFGWKSKLLKRHAVCKSCTAKRSNSWYYANKDSHIENVMVHKRESRILARQFVWDYLFSTLTWVVFRVDHGSAYGCSKVD